MDDQTQHSQGELDQHPNPPGGRSESLDKHPGAATSSSATGHGGIGATSVGTGCGCQRTTITGEGENGDEKSEPGFIGNYHKGLPHDRNGVVAREHYEAFVEILTSKDVSQFMRMPTDLGRKLVNPLAGLAEDPVGGKQDSISIRPAPKVKSPEAAYEAIELYWMALMRDVAFSDYDASADAADAATELSGAPDRMFTGPRKDGKVTSATLFRGCSPGDCAGPYISQFLFKEIPYGPQRISQRIRTVLPNRNYLLAWDEWLAVQNGVTNVPMDAYDPTMRYIRNLRDLGEYVHVDALYQAYLNACLILLGEKTRLDAGNPYAAPDYYSDVRLLEGKLAKTQIGFGTFGGPHILSLVTEIATRALQAVWWQKWFVHRRLRPEAFGGLIHATLHRGANLLELTNPVFQSKALSQTQSRWGTSLMPMQFPEGSPTHPSYGAGHATVAGACVTILKAWFDESIPVRNPVVPNWDGTELVPYQGSDAGSLTLGGELNKLAANISIGRNGAGVHWRSDYFESIRLGERVAVEYLQKLAAHDAFKEPWSLKFTSFDGQLISVGSAGPLKRLALAAERPCVDPGIAIQIVFACLVEHGAGDASGEDRLGDLFPDPDARDRFCVCVASRAGIPRSQVACGQNTTVNAVVDSISC